MQLLAVFAEFSLSVSNVKNVTTYFLVYTGKRLHVSHNTCEGDAF